MKIKTTTLALLMASFSATLPAQQTSWKSHPSIQQLKESATGIFPDMPFLEGMLMVLLLIAGAIWSRYFWVAWREMRMHSVRRELRQLSTPGGEYSMEKPGEPSGLSSLFKDEDQSTSRQYHLKAASDAPSADAKISR